MLPQPRTGEFSRLGQALAEPPEQADQRARRWLLDRAGDGPWILHGAGNLGRQIYAHMQSHGEKVLAVTDGDPKQVGVPIGNHRVQAPAEALERWGAEAATLVTICNTRHSFQATARRLQPLSKGPVLPVQGYFWRRPEAFLPYFAFDLPSRLLRAREDLLRTAALLADPLSRSQYEGQVAWRLTLDFDLLPLAQPETQYFDPDLRPQELDGLFVDCGAFDGDTLRDLFAVYGSGLTGAIAYEPDPANFGQLQAWVQGLPSELRERIDCREAALSDQKGWLCFQGGNDGGSRLAETGGSRVRAVRLDEDLSGLRVGWLKMDLEGQELQALAGSLLLPRPEHRTYTISMYHRSDDLWTIPAFFAKHLPAHSLHLRTHGEDGFDVVCYALPPAAPTS